MASSTTPIPPLRVGWMPFGAYTNGWTGHLWGEMRLPVPGFAVMTSIKRDENLLWCIGAALCRQHGDHDSLGCIHVHNGWHADAGRLDDVNDVDARAGLV